jgi:hypothetical protein
MLKRLLLGAGLAALIAGPAHATLQLSISANGSTFSCFDGELSCDVSGGANNLLTIDTTIGGAFVQLTLAQSSFGRTNELQLSSSNIINQSGAPIDIKLLASDTNFVNPITGIRESSSLTFNSAIGSPASFLQFWADPNNVQGANLTNTPGTLLFTATGTPVTDPDSFDGTHFNPFVLDAPFSMTEGASLNLISGATVTGFNEAMQTSVPEPKTWALLGVGFAVMGLMGLRGRKDRLASIV